MLDARWEGSDFAEGFVFVRFSLMKQFTSTGYRTFTIFASFLLPVKLPDLFFKHRQALSGEYKEVDPDS